MELPKLTKEESERVATILCFSQDYVNVNKIDFDAIVTDASMKEYLGY